ncbi:PorP/SprF family type IX secretion system membrane protein [Lewinella sp. W8]|uniref:PorP/SprF family type IX secretion system membrane protein n=1 Tax=Lewinella sp. W8 TaxID=2528208 RepID=UPI001068B400|nr:PorP/SprF family type IX secretion system membrane protein [Lewinella sp. W8]MTB51748.1 type IX secretion system membrane protein PorP/SprF [Lewinella sp. W8]
MLSQKLIILLLFLPGLLAGQDGLFTNFDEASFYHNPALTGFIPGDATTRLQFRGREQWRSFLGNGAYRTMTAGIERRFCGADDGDYFAFGSYAMADWQGDPSLRRIDFFGTAAYTKDFSSRFQTRLLSGGVEAGYLQYNLEQGNLTFDDQFDDPDLPDELLAFQNLLVFDYGIGVFLTQFEKGKNGYGFSLGVSAKHLGQPELRFIDNPATDNQTSVKLPTRWTFHAGGNLPTPALGNTTLSVLGVASFQGPHNQFLGRALLNLERTKTGDGRYLSLGAAYRVNAGVNGPGGDAVILVGQWNGPGYRFSANYDINVSRLRSATNSVGALELSFFAFFGKSDCIRCPRW